MQASQDDPDVVRSQGTATAVGLIVLGVTLGAARIVEAASRAVTNADADDPAVSLQYIEDSVAFVWSGILLLLAAAGLVIATTGTRHLLRRGGAGALTVDAVAATGVIAACALLLAGVSHAATSGPLLYMRSLDTAWGEAAYMAVQVIGNQTIYAGGTLALAVWQIAVSILAWRTHILPAGLAAFALPALLFASTIFGALIPAPDSLFLANLAALFVGMPLWGVAYGIAIALRTRRA